MKSPPSETSAAPLLLGQQPPRIRLVPDAVSSAGIEAIELAAAAGLGLDPWQGQILVDALGEKADGRWAAFEVATVVPRQNGKGSILEARELAGAILFEEKLLIHSAHEQATSSEHFFRLLALIEEADFQRRIKRAIKGKGSEAIVFKDGTRILFKTRTGGGGRGLTGDFVGLDEAMILPVAATGALVPTMAARSVTGNPQLWLAGSAVDRKIHEHGIVLSRLRARALRKAANLAYVEFSSPIGDPENDDPDAVPAAVLDDPEMWHAGNPGLGIRMSRQHVAKERDALDSRTFAVERMGIGDWPDPDEKKYVLDPALWTALEDAMSKITGPCHLAYDVAPDMHSAAIAVAGRRTDGLVHVETIDHLPNSTWVPVRLQGLVAEHDVRSPVRYADDGTAGSLLGDINALKGRKVKTKPVNSREHGQAFGAFVSLVTNAGLRHLNTPEMLAALKGAAARPLGDAQAWARKTSTVDITPLVAATLALRALADAEAKPPGPVAAVIRPR